MLGLQESTVCMLQAFPKEYVTRHEPVEQLNDAHCLKHKVAGSSRVDLMRKDYKAKTSPTG